MGAKLYKKIIKIIIISIIICILILLIKEIIQTFIYQIEIIENYYKELELKGVIKDSNDYSYRVYCISLLKKSINFILKIIIEFIKYINNYTIIKDIREKIFKNFFSLIYEIHWNRKNIQIMILNMFSYIIKLSIIIIVTILQYIYIIFIKIYYIVKFCYKIIVYDFKELFSWIKYIIRKIIKLISFILYEFYKWSLVNCPEMNHNISKTLQKFYVEKNMLRFVYVIFKEWEYLEVIKFNKVIQVIQAIIKYLMKR